MAAAWQEAVRSATAAGDPARAGALLEEAIAADPRDRLARRERVRLALAAGDHRAALPHLEALVAAEPRNPDGQGMLGMLRRALGDRAGAAAAFEAAYQLRPGHVPTAHLLGGILVELNDIPRAIEVLGAATRLAPREAPVLATYAAALVRAERLAEGEAMARRALALDPSQVEAWVNLGTARRLQGDNAGALAATEDALRRAPHLPEAHVNRALALLSLGRLEEGWRANEWYWRQPHTPPRPFRQPWWDGGDAAGAILVWGDQGIGDQIWAAAFLPALVEAGHRLVVECERRLSPLFARSFPAIEVIARADPPDPRLARPDLVAQTPITRLAALAWRRDGTRARPDHRLAVDPARRDAIRGRYQAEARGRRTVGIAWRSRKPDGRLVELPLALWAPLLTQPGLMMVDLQYGDTAADRAAVVAGLGVTVYRDPDVDSMADLDGFAAQVAALDHVATAVNVTVATALAVGTPVDVAVRAYQPDWRYPPASAASPWLPGAGLHRQSDPARWEDVMAAIAASARGGN
ncbi:MAG: tetratricopeptide repeat protein [Alphaproteobacteria bacterium]